MIDSHSSLMPAMNSALDCGAGIGRVAKEVLKPRFNFVDLVEPSKVQMDQARVYCKKVAREFYEVGLEEF